MSDYFNDEVQTPERPGRFTRVSDAPSAEMAPGVILRPILGENVLLSFADIAPGALAPLHAHPEEQLVIVLEGEMDFTIGEETRTMGPGDVALVPPWVQHSALGGPQGCREIDVFNPPRAGLRALLESTGAETASSLEATDKTTADE